MKSIYGVLSLIIIFSSLVATVKAQETMYIYKDGTVVGEHVLAEVDSVIFYKANSCELGTVTDIDGNTYRTVVIGDQTWMAENIRVTHFPYGTPIPNVDDRKVDGVGANKDAWNALGDNNVDKAYCWYLNDSTQYAEIYGALYTYAAATNGTPYTTQDVQGLCPDGWHIPNREEMSMLGSFVESDGHDLSGGVALKGKSGWYNDGNGTDDYCFNALPVGQRYGNGNFYHNFQTLTLKGSTEGSNTTGAYGGQLSWNSDRLARYYGSTKSYGNPVRCVKNKYTQSWLIG